MIETVAKVALPVDEHLLIQRNRLCPEQTDGGEKRLCIVTGIHGNELEGQYVCYELARRIQAEKGHLRGIVDLYPAVNPLGINSVSREIPLSEMDMNRMFPGVSDGAVDEYLAAKVIRDIGDADLCIDIHSSNVFLKEVPQARILRENEERLLPFAKLLNVDFIWVSNTSTVMEASLVQSLNKKGVPAIAAAMGTGLRINMEYGKQLTDGIFRLMTELGIWDGEAPAVKTPIISSEGRVAAIHAGTDGIFLPCAEHWKSIRKGETLGIIADPLSGTVKEEIKATFTGMIFTMREYPVVTEGSLIARILGGTAV